MCVLVCDKQVIVLYMEHMENLLMHTYIYFCYWAEEIASYFTSIDQYKRNQCVCNKVAFQSHWPTDMDINSLLPSDVIWWQGSKSTLAQIMACCLTAPRHYLSQCWLMISEVLWHSPDSNFTENTWHIYRWNEFEIYRVETVDNPPRANELKEQI